MPKQTTFQVQNRQVVGTLEDQHKYDLPTLRRLGVVADPVNLEVKPAATGAMKLAAALAEAKPEINSVLNGMATEAGDNKEEQGVTAGLTSGNQSYDEAVAAVSGEHPRYQAGFLRSKGFITGEQLSSKMMADFEAAKRADLDKQGAPTFDANKWVSDWWKNNTQGYSNPQFLAGMNKVMAKSMAEVQDAWGKEVVQLVEEQRGNNYKDFVKGDLKGEGWTPELFGQRVTDWLATNGGSRKDVSKWTQELVKAAVENGDVDTVEKLVQLKDYKGTDGVKPYAKVFEDDINLIAKSASNFGQADRLKREAAHTKALNELDSELVDIAQLGLTGSTDEARIKLDALKADPRFKGIGFEKMIQLNNVFNGAFKKEDSQDAQILTSDLLVKIHTGKATYDSVVGALRDNKIAPSQANMLFNAIKSNQMEARKLAQEGKSVDRMERAALKETILRSSFAHLDRMNTQMLGDEAALAYEQNRALLIYSATQELQDVLSSKDPSAKQEFILKNQKRAADLYKQTINAEEDNWKTYKPKYASKAALEKAINEQGVTPELQKELRYRSFMAQQGNAK